MTEPGSSRGCLRDEDVFVLLEGGTDEDLEPLRAHLDACEGCQDLVALASARDEVVIRDGDTILDRYRVLGELGRGGMGVVFRVHDPKLHRDLAVKILHSVDPSAPLRLEREAQALARLSHPNIVTVFDIGGLRDQVCMVMELVDGSSLRAWLESARSREEILRVFRQAAEGLHAAHQAGLVHRDFKPENVLVGDGERVKIVDFGLAAADLVPAGGEASFVSTLAHASALHRLTRTGRAIGTPAYMAPEQFRGIEADTRSDQFSFAVCLWEALHGEHPFHAATIEDLRRNIERGPAGSPDVRRRDGVTGPLRRALSVDPSARFASMEDLLRELGAEPPARPRSRAASVSVGFVAVTVVAGAGFLLAARSSQAVRAPAAADVATLARASSSSSSSSSPSLEPSPEPSPALPVSPASASSAESDAGVRPETAPWPAAVRRAPSPALKSPPSRAAASSPAASSPPARGPNGAPLIE